MTPDLLTYMERLNPRQGAFVRQITKFYYDFHWEWEHLIGCVINDPLAVAYFIKPELCFGFESNVQIETQGICRGESVVDAYHFYKRKANAVVLTKVNVKEFYYLFFGYMLHKKREELDLIEKLVMCQEEL